MWCAHLRLGLCLQVRSLMFRYDFLGCHLSSRLGGPCNESVLLGEQPWMLESNFFYPNGNSST